MRAQAVIFHLFVNQMLTRNLALFVLGVSGQRDDLHPVQKRRRHVISVGRSDEHDVREVVFNLEIVIGEGRVLFRIKHFEHGRCRVTAKILTHLVDLVQKDQRVRGFCLFQRLDDLAGHRPDIGPPVAANFALVAHPAKRDTDKLAPRGPCHRFSQRRLADTRGSDQTEDRALEFLGSLLNRQIFDDAFLDFLKPVMVVIQHLLGAAKVPFDPALDAPGYRQHPVEIIAHDGRFGRHRRH